MLKMNRLLNVIFFTLTFVTFSQKDSITVYQVQFERILTFDDATEPHVSVYNYTKFVELNKSFYDRNIKVKNNGNLIKSKEDNTILDFIPSGKNTSVVFKDYDKKETFSKYEVAYKYFVVKDSLDIFKWNILNESKDILGYTCQLATMNFRGRDYEAWFSSKLPVGGPWKFDGLPGLILEMKSVDNFISFKAISLKNLKVESKTLNNPFETKGVINWEEFTALYKRKAIELISFKPDEGSGGIESSRGGIEEYIHKDDKEYNEALKKIIGNN
ncbi:MAG: hypothetical protein COZ16_06750 [Flavobacteriaceae bacterium CG_4_10_14_3_um_filter_31_253]|nr:MAG: hypothetical protein AUK46_11935 [Flavobacteriaceae bacterium CG2_30_31_66]PIV96800.1 MAG: hypothetical protein COW43_06545 [Flavobacteriaceae bacterium CG17_big_fil_post_rev_8_21_14_2_50_31_13]PIX11999.1 MAG: hypothetical protein COZ74_12525 [Flavobacteriaceae bacterium CG_4_8_14_3_um_filter_31_8]PIY14973.1 MAG: hypothetical protein COZ16_06750 [Flavobacteriaceae bacterium CG_4_10_14_3_um_filter_31_253]PIZ11665.1 MAG: hypothetical protein COY55_04020 [Flavobacteriaceae bacterium CG_4_1